jgi:glycosyltransferase involved in cell wall biosynthesis
MPDPCERPPIAGAPLSAVLLAYNEGPTFEEVVTAWLAYLNGLQREYEILLVDDGSTDETGAWADALAGRYPRLQVLHHDRRRGFGAALRTGIAAARHPLVFYTTCDRQYEPSDLKVLFDLINQVDLVTGIRVWQPVPGWLRFLDGLYRRIARVVFGVPLEPRKVWLGWSGLGRRLLARWVFGLALQDVECAFRLFRRSVFVRTPLQSEGPFAQVEILAKANYCFWLAEAPVTYRPRGQGGITGDDLPRRTWAEARRLFREPDFGPAVLLEKDRQDFQDDAHLAFRRPPC